VVEEVLADFRNGLKGGRSSEIGTEPPVATRGGGPLEHRGKGPDSSWALEKAKKIEARWPDFVSVSVEVAENHRVGPYESGQGEFVVYRHVAGIGLDDHNRGESDGVSEQPDQLER